MHSDLAAIAGLFIAVYALLETIACFVSNERSEAAEAAKRFLWRLTVALLLLSIYLALSDGP